ncbi:MAG: sialidase family protein [Bryobacteraceae bacterium]
MRIFLPLIAVLPLFAIESTRIWDAAPHSAFTDLIRYKGRWLCVFREGRAHVSPDGSIRILLSDDGQKWQSIAELKQPNRDLRDPKITHTPKGELMLTAAAAHRERDGQTPVPHDSLAWFSKDGRTWSEPTKIGDPNFWLWRAAWHRNQVLMVGYPTGSRDGATRLYSSSDGRKFQTLIPEFVKDGFPNESTIIFQKDGAALCLVRRDGKGFSGLIGAAGPPYKDWTWSDVGARVGGPNFIELPNGRLIGVVRLYDNKTRTSIVELNATGGIKELETLPSNGDSSYAGLVWRKGELWISYYSSHEGKTSIYLARWKP